MNQTSNKNRPRLSVNVRVYRSNEGPVRLVSFGGGQAKPGEYVYCLSLSVKQVRGTGQASLYSIEHLERLQKRLSGVPTFTGRELLRDIQWVRVWNLTLSQICALLRTAYERVSSSPIPDIIIPPEPRPIRPPVDDKESGLCLFSGSYRRPEDPPLQAESRIPAAAAEQSLRAIFGEEETARPDPEPVPERVSWEAYVLQCRNEFRLMELPPEPAWQPSRETLWRYYEQELSPQDVAQLYLLRVRHHDEALDPWTPCNDTEESNNG